MDNIGSRLTSLYNSYYEPGMRVLEKTSLIALGILAFKADKKYFFPFCAAGVLFGAHNYFQNRKTVHHKGDCHCDTKDEGKVDLNNCHPTSLSCSQGLLEQASGVKLPAPISLLVNVALVVDHLSDHHHSKSYVSIIGLYLGSWIGKDCMSLLHRVTKT